LLRIKKRSDGSGLVPHSLFNVALSNEKIGAAGVQIAEPELLVSASRTAARAIDDLRFMARRG
jgi:hypothetical protein